jgi:hypothetical protein
VLFVSGYAPDSVMQGEFSSEGVSFLAKPFAPTALVRKVRELIEMR